MIASEAWKKGRVIACRSERFGEHDFLCVKKPGKTAEDRMLFVEILPNGELKEALFFSSVRRDVVIDTWDTILDYYAAIFIQ